jgi:hypothetical protein
MKKIYGWIIVVALVCVFYACTGGSIDSLLDEYDKLVSDMVKYSREAIQLSNSDSSDPVKDFARLAVIQKELEKFQKKSEVIGKKLDKYEDAMTSEQTERLTRTMFKMLQVMGYE